MNTNISSSGIWCSNKIYITSVDLITKIWDKINRYNIFIYDLWPLKRSSSSFSDVFFVHLTRGQRRGWLVVVHLGIWGPCGFHVRTAGCFSSCPSTSGASEGQPKRSIFCDAKHSNRKWIEPLLTQIKHDKSLWHQDEIPCSFSCLMWKPGYCLANWPTAKSEV